MLPRWKTTTVTRRGAFLLAGAGVSALFPVGTLQRMAAAEPEFWDKKPPAEWTHQEIDRLLTRSPWSKEVTANYAPREGGNPFGGLGGRRREKQAPRDVGHSYKGTVRWESAKPILAAHKAPLPSQFTNHFVIGVIGFPIVNGPEESDQHRQAGGDPDDNLKQFTTLQPKGNDLAQAGVVLRQPGTNDSFLFGFSSELVQMSMADGEAAFSTRLGQLTVKARFVFKEMLYHGELAL